MLLWSIRFCHRLFKYRLFKKSIWHLSCNISFCFFIILIFQFIISIHTCFNHNNDNIIKFCLHQLIVAKIKFCLYHLIVTNRLYFFSKRNQFIVSCCIISLTHRQFDVCCQFVKCQHYQKHRCVKFSTRRFSINQSSLRRQILFRRD